MHLSAWDWLPSERYHSSRIGEPQFFAAHRLGCRWQAVNIRAGRSGSFAQASPPKRSVESPTIFSSMPSASEKLAYSHERRCSHFSMRVTPDRFVELTNIPGVNPHSMQALSLDAPWSVFGVFQLPVFEDLIRSVEYQRASASLGQAGDVRSSQTLLSQPGGWIHLKENAGPRQQSHQSRVEGHRPCRHRP